MAFPCGEPTAYGIFPQADGHINLGSSSGALRIGEELPCRRNQFNRMILDAAKDYCLPTYRT